MARLLKIREKRISDWKTCLKDFEVFKLAQGVCETTLKDYRWHLGRFFNEFPDVWGDNEELRWAVIKYFANGNNLAPATHNIRRKYLKAFFSWAVKEGIIQTNPVEGISLRREEPRVRQIDEDKLKRLLAIPDKTTYSGLGDYVLLCLTIDTGIRPKEALGLVPNDFNLRGMEVHVPAKIAKTRISRTLPLSALQTELPPNDPHASASLLPLAQRKRRNPR